MLSASPRLFVIKRDQPRDGDAAPISMPARYSSDANAAEDNSAQPVNQDDEVNATSEDDQLP